MKSPIYVSAVWIATIAVFSGLVGCASYGGRNKEISLNAPDAANTYFVPLEDWPPIRDELMQSDAKFTEKNNALADVRAKLKQYKIVDESADRHPYQSVYVAEWDKDETVTFKWKTVKPGKDTSAELKLTDR